MRHVWRIAVIVLLGACAEVQVLGQNSAGILRDGGAEVTNAIFKSWDLPRPGTRPGAPDFDSKGNVWFSVSGKLGFLDLETGKITEYDPPGSDVPSVCRVKNDFIWCTSLSSGRGGMSSTADNVPQGSVQVGLGDEAMDVTARPRLTGNAVLRFDPRDKTFRTYKVATPNSGPDRSDFDSKGNLWFSEIIGNQIAKLNLESGIITEYAVPTWTIPEAPGNKQTGTTYPYGLEVDKFDNVWMAQNRGYKITKLDPVTETFTEFVPPTGLNGTRNLDSDDQGNVWFTSSYKGIVGKIDAKSGIITEYRVPGINAYPYHIRVDSKGNVWFWDQVYSYMTVFDPKTEKYATYKPPWAEHQVVSRHLRIDARGRVFFPDENHSKIGMIDIPAMAAGGDGSQP